MIVVVGLPAWNPGPPPLPSGRACGIALAAAGAGANVEFMGRIGDDPAGDALLMALGRAGVGHAALLKRIELAKNRPAGDPQALAERIAANPKDFDARFALAAIKVYEGDFAAAFEQLLEVVLRDKAEWREKARLQLVEWFAVCPDAEVVSRGRRYLGMYLN